MGNLTTHGWLTALHHQLIDRASVSFFYWPNQNGVEPTWPLCLQALSPLLLLSFSHIFSPTLFKCSCGHESYSLLRIYTSGLTNQRLDQPATPLSSPASILHSSTLTRSVLHNFLWFRLLAIEANVSSVWFKWVFLFLCILNFLLYFNLGNRRVRLVALWVHFKCFIYSVYLFFNIHFNNPL